MSFLFPLYLLGVLAVSLPILLHLRKRPPKEKVPFGSLMFLEKSPEKLTRRTRIERWILLALRALALLALAMVFSRPFIRSATLPAELPDGSIRIVLIDRSASMQREDLTQQAMKKTSEVIRDSGRKDDLAVLIFGRDCQTLIDFSEWEDRTGASRASEFVRRMETLPIGWDRADPGNALVEAADRIAAQSADRDYRDSEITLISDFKEGADFDALNQVAWPENLVVDPVALAPKNPGNLSINLAASTLENQTATRRIHRVRISNSSASRNERFELQWEGDPDSRISGIVPSGASRVLRAPEPSEGLSPAKLVLSGDRHPYDNSVFIAPPQPIPLSIVFITGSDEPDTVGSPYFYLKRALHPTAALTPTLTSTPPDSVDSGAADVFVLHDQWDEATAQSIHEKAADGSLVIALPGPNLEAAALSKLTGIPDLSIAEAEGDDYAMLANLDFNHRVLSPFARAKIRDFTKIRFWKHRQLTFPGDQPPDDVAVLADFDNGHPAWLSRQIGEGSVFLFLSGWQPQESQFALSSKFVPILYSIFENSGYSARSAPTYYVGDVEVLQDGVITTADRPGIFGSPESNQDGISLAVNLHPSEGRVDPVDPDHLLTGFNIGLPLPPAELAKKEETDPVARKQLEYEEKESNQKLWKWFVLAVMLFLLVESWLSGRRPQAASAS